MYDETTPIYHITQRQQWEQARQVGLYRGDTLATEGFIHCSTGEQVVRTANHLFAGQRDLVLLCIDPGRVTAEIRYEALIGDESFPHIYGPLEVSAVSRVATFEPDKSGLFHMPPEFIQ